MTVTVTHAFASAVADDPASAAAGEVLPSHWNAGHTVTVTGIREAITADRTYYVRPDGSDSNTGLVNTAGGAYLTIAKAMLTCSQIDFNGYIVTVQLSGTTPATFAERVIIPVVVGCRSRDYFVLIGDETTPANFVVGTSSTDSGAVELPYGAVGTIKGVKFNNVHARGYGLYVYGGDCAFVNCDFAAAFRHMVCEGGYIRLAFPYNYNVTGDSTEFHLFADGTAANIICSFGTASMGVRSLSVCANSQNGGYIVSQGMTFSGTITAKRYNAEMTGIIQTYGGGAAYFPGATVGTTATGGQYA